MGIQDRDYWREWKRGQERRSAPRSSSTAKPWSGVPAWIVCIAVIFVAAISIKPYLNARRGTIPFPMTGEVYWYVSEPIGPQAPFAIVAPPVASIDFVVRLDRWETKQPIAMIPVRSGETASLQVPLGLYRVTIVKGSRWRGPDKLFGVTNDAKEAVEPLSFHRTGNTLAGHTIQLDMWPGNIVTRQSRLGY